MNRIICSYCNEKYCNLYHLPCNSGQTCRNKGKEYGIETFTCKCGHMIPKGSPYDGEYQCMVCGSIYNLNGKLIK